MKQLTTRVSRSLLVGLSLGFLSTTAISKATSDTVIVRNIDAKKEVREFPDLVSYLNTSLQKAPAPVVGELAREQFGKPAIIRCWLNLDEMWDYRTRKYDYNFTIGVDKYKDIPQKHRETWDWEVESEVKYYDYLSAFSANSEEIMLTIRRYETDIINGNLPITMKDWKTIFKTGLKHYKAKFPNIRYIEVCNEYHLKGFMNGTDDQFYEFYKLGYEAVNEVNKEMKLEGKDRILVGGPVSTGNPLPRVEALARNFVNDPNPKKALDFVSWHEYTVPMEQTAFRESQIRSILRNYGLNESLPMFVSEHDPYHYDKDSDERHFSNAAALVKSLYFTSLFSPNIKIFPWVLYHNEDLQTRFKWFKGPNLTNTRADELKMLPIGVSMKLLSMHQGKEIKVANDLDWDDIVVASKDGATIRVHAVNLGSMRPIRILLDNVINGANEKVTVKKYVLDETHNNLLADNDYGGRPVPEEANQTALNKGDALLLQHSNIGKYGTVFWEITLN